MLLLTLRGTPTVYYGDEIGMMNAEVPGELISDPLGKAVPALGRDGARSSMRWDGSRFCGFSEAPPWCVGSNEGPPNVTEQEGNHTSMLALYKRLIRARRHNPTLAVGSYHPLEATGDVLLFRRNHSGCPSVIVALNLGDQPAAAILHGVQSTGRVVVSTLADRDGEAVKDEIDLRPHEGLLIELST